MLTFAARAVALLAAATSLASATTIGGEHHAYGHPHHPHGEVIVTGEHCAKECTETYWVCREKPHAHIGACTTEYAGCLGYNPFDKGPEHVPTHCVEPKHKIIITEEHKERCVCAEHCTVKWKHCGIDVPHCRHEYEGCLGYNPFNKGPHHRAAACVDVHHRPHHTGIIEVVPHHPHQDACARACVDSYNGCRGRHGAHVGPCGSEYTTCLGYNPFEKGADHVPTACVHEVGTVVEYPPVVVTGAAENVRPAVALLGLVAAAML